MNIQFPVILNESLYALAAINGEYHPQASQEQYSAALVLYLWVTENDSHFRFYYIGKEGNILGCYEDFEAEDSLEYVLMKAWCDHNIMPQYWHLLEEFHLDIEFDNENISIQYMIAYNTLRRVVSKFRWIDMIKSLEVDKETSQKYPLFAPELEEGLEALSSDH